MSHHQAASETPGILLEAQASAAGSQTAWTCGSQVSQHSRPLSSARRKPQASQAMPASRPRQPRLETQVFHPAHLSRWKEQPTVAQVLRATTAGCQGGHLGPGSQPSAWGQEKEGLQLFPAKVHQPWEQKASVEAFEVDRKEGHPAQSSSLCRRRRKMPDGATEEPPAASG